MELTDKHIEKVISGNLRHANHTENVELAESIRVHADGLYPDKLIDQRRPNEAQEIKEYRKKIYKPITRRPFGKVLTSLGKIRRSSDWIIRHIDEDKIPNILVEGKRLEDYTERNFPEHGSLTNWAFSELLKQYLIDANAVIGIKPCSLPTDASEFTEPEAEVFSSENVLDWREGEYAILQSSETVVLGEQSNGTITNGKVFYVYTRSYIQRWEQVSIEGKFSASYTLSVSEFLPFKVKGLLLKKCNGEAIYESRIAKMVPHLDEAVREYSDLQASIVQHQYPEKYVYTNTDCPDCSGSGKMGNPGERKTCERCDGRGSIADVSPYGMLTINAARIKEEQVPSPPIGYIQKDMSIIDTQDRRIEAHIFKALSAINMEFLAEAPLNQSGTAKEVDRDELNNFVNLIAEDIITILDKAYYQINELRYSTAIPNEKDRRAMLPTVNVPERFDILSSTYLLEELVKATSAGVNPVVLRSMQIEYAGKKFSATPEIAKQLQEVYELDPLPGVNEEDKALRLSNNGITPQDYIISSNIDQFIRRATLENTNFYGMKYEEKMTILKTYAEEVASETSAKESAAKLVLDESEPAGENG